MSPCDFDGHRLEVCNAFFASRALPKNLILDTTVSRHGKLLITELIEALARRPRFHNRLRSSGIVEAFGRQFEFRIDSGGRLAIREAI